MKTKKIITVIAILLMTASVACAYSHDSGAKKGYGAEGSLCMQMARGMKYKTELALSMEQETQLKALEIAMKKELIRQNADIDIIDVDLKAGMLEDVIDRDALNMLIDKKYEMKKEKAKYLLGVHAQFKEMLSKEQHDMLKNLAHKGMQKKCSK